MTFTAMPFGKHKGTKLTQLDQSYIQWMLKNVELKDPLRAALVAELQRREDGGNVEAPDDPIPDNPRDPDHPMPTNPRPRAADDHIRDIVRQELAGLFRRAAITLDKLRLPHDTE